MAASSLLRVVGFAEIVEVEFVDELAERGQLLELLGGHAGRLIGGVDGLIYGNPLQLLQQAGAVGITLVYTFVVSYAIAFILDRTIGLRVSEEEERMGLDVGEHGMEAYGGFQITH